tara:strand:- start:802 stop:1092 length:291 start_codon:yes stop_codon:yes gene_type:complete
MKAFTGLGVFLLLLIVLVITRRVDESTYQLMIIDDVFKMERLCEKVNKYNLKEDEIEYNSYINEYGVSICSDPKELIEVIKNKYKLMYLNQVRFVY